MRIAVYGGAGAMGSRIVAEALGRDHLATVVTRRPTSVPLGAVARLGDAADADDVAKVSAEYDVVVSAIAPDRTGGRVERFLSALETLAKNVGTRRLIVVGGSGSLCVAPGLRLMDAPGFAPALRPEALAQAAALEGFRSGGGFVDWVYISPAPITTPGRRTGAYRSGTDALLGDYISMEDFAVAVVDEIEQPRHRRQRFAVSS